MTKTTTTATLTVCIHLEFLPVDGLAVCPAELLSGYRNRWFGAHRYVEAVLSGGQPVQVASEDPTFLWMLREWAHDKGVPFFLEVLQPTRKVLYAEWELEMCTRYHIIPWRVEDSSGKIRFPLPSFTDYEMKEPEDAPISEEYGEYVIPVVPVDPAVEHLVNHYCAQFTRGTRDE